MLDPKHDCKMMKWERDKMRNQMEYQTVSIRNIDSEAWKQFRVLCLQENESVSDRINRLIQKDVKANS
jgi:hypothetical protein